MRLSEELWRELTAGDEVATPWTAGFDTFEEYGRWPPPQPGGCPLRGGWCLRAGASRGRAGDQTGAVTVNFGTNQELGGENKTSSGGWYIVLPRAIP